MGDSYTRLVTSLLALSVGNSRTHIGRFDDLGAGLSASEQIENAHADLIVERVAHHFGMLDTDDAVVALASVNDRIADALVARLEGRLATTIVRIGRDLSAPISTRLDPGVKTGVDRLLCAAAAYRTLKQACVVIDCGTAITIDFVDGEGTFHGGAIAPGAQLQLDALHTRTAALPEVRFREPDAEPVGRNTEQAMLQGVVHGVRGLVQRLVERYAEAQGAFPIVVATGGDAQTLLQDTELVDRIVPDLVLMGIAAAVGSDLVDDAACDE